MKQLQTSLEVRLSWILNLTTIILIISFLFSCEKKNEVDVILEIFSGSETIQLSNLSLCNDDRYLYFLINDKEIQKEVIEELVIDKMILNYNDKKIIAKPIKIFSSQLPDTSLNFPVDQESKKLNFLKRDDGKWFFLALTSNEDAIIDDLLLTLDNCSW